MTDSPRDALTTIRPFSRIAALLACAFLTGSVAAEQAAAPDAPETAPMNAKLRQSFSNIVVRAGTATAGQFVTGTYQKDVMDMGEGVQRGRELGRVGREVGGVPIYFPIRIISVPAQILGGLAGRTQEEIQDFRDRLTRDLMEAQDQPMTNDALADDVFWRVRSAPGVKAKILAVDKPIPPETDAVLFVSLDSVQMTVEGKDAVITTTATAALQRVSDGEHVFDQRISYRDKDELGDWIANDDAAWHSYAAYARHYLGREIAARLYERVGEWETTQPRKSSDIKPVKRNLWRGKSKSATPTLAWKVALTDEGVDSSAIRYDLEIYDLEQQVYGERGLQATEFRLPHALDGCKTYYWSVRPVLQEASGKRYGEWMRFQNGGTTARGSSGPKASEAPAYLYDFAAFDVACR